MPLRDDGDRDRMDRDILDIIPERFDADADSRHARKSALNRVILSISLAILVVAALLVAARHILFGDAPRDRQLAAPVIHADDKPIKVKPQDRGGMDVPNQDKLIYERMGSKNAEQQPERLLPPPEQAQTPPPAVTASAPTAAAALPPPIAPPAPTAAKPAATPPATAMKAALPPPPPVAMKAVPPPPAVTVPPSNAAKTGGWVVQLGAVRSEAEAKAEWIRLRGAHKEELGDLTSDIVRVDLGAKGIFWRVRGGPLDEAQARLLCAQLTKLGQDCLIAHR